MELKPGNRVRVKADLEPDLDDLLGAEGIVKEENTKVGGWNIEFPKYEGYFQFFEDELEFLGPERDEEEEDPLYLLRKLV